MWQLARVDNLAGSALWFSDGKDLFAVRGGRSDSVRLIISNQGFIDFTNIESSGATLGSYSRPPQRLSHVDLNHRAIAISDSDPSAPVRIHLILPGDGSFRFSPSTNDFYTGKLKPLLRVSKTDMEYFQQMIDHGPVSRPILDYEEGKTHEEIRELGLQYFPNSPYSFQLAMAIYDWTTASFLRMVLMKMFEYTAVTGNPPPIDKDSVASAIFEANWLSYTPSNPEFMSSFLMKPAKTKQEVAAQLDVVLPELHHFSDVENRILAAAAASMPRTPKLITPLLYSGQLDVYQFKLDQFAAQFTQCPLNDGPPGVPLRIDLDQVLETFLHPGKVITTKQFWSFSDSMDTAMLFQNGIVLVAEPPDDDSFVWETPCYVTPISTMEEKIEWIFPLGTSFTVLATERREIHEVSVVVITLRQISPNNHTDATQPFCEASFSKLPSSLSPSKSDTVLPDDRKLSTFGVPHYKAWTWGAFALSVMLALLLCGLFYIC
ncbi:unnamed protein product [Rhizoctonia solani]|uniref:Uncharacterized protein n=1 Tax=Rhizoctonia solani TaxID=456999 RepID=A0A8H3D474_9AGAM|nr:unnamed protein product [Rhizoctonia solani]